MSTAAAHMDLDRITHPLRLARGSHQPGSDKGCAMNAISFINGDEFITDFPTCSARPLAILIQACNDLLAAPGGYLSPEHSVLALELAWQTVGTAGVADTVVHAWLAELLTNPVWGRCPIRQTHRGEGDPRHRRAAPPGRPRRLASHCRLGRRRPCRTCRRPRGEPDVQPGRRIRHPGRIRVDHTRQRAPLSIDAGRRDRVRRARPHAGQCGRRSQSHRGTGQAGNPLVASIRRAGQLGQRVNIGEQSTQSGFPG